jgi:ribosome-associated protein
VPDLKLDPEWHIPEADLDIRFVRSPGPGGQNVNKLATKVELRLKLAQCASLDVGQKRRLAAKFPAHVTQRGEFVLTSDRFRSQWRNQQDALERLAEMIRSIRRPPKRRVPTRATAASQRRRVEQKRARGELKRQRKSRDHD